MPHLSNTRKNKYAPNVNHEGQTRFIKDIENGTLIGYKFFAFTGTAKIQVITRGSAGTLMVMTEQKKPLATIRLQHANDWMSSETVSFQASGKLPLYLYYQGKGKIDLLRLSLQEES